LENEFVVSDSLLSFNEIAVLNLENELIVSLSVLSKMKELF
jgi:hypothetical protein